MRWTPGHRSSNLEDRRGLGGGGGGLGLGGAFAIFSLLSRFGWPGIIIGGVLFFVLGGSNLFAPSGGSQLASSDRAHATQGQDEPMVQFVSFVLDDAQATWTRKFAEQSATYRPARLVLFRGGTSSGCGFGQSAMGPFYCPSDERVYIDLAFYDELKQRFGAPGDFAQAYVIAHEIGHHLQHVLGIAQRVSKGQGAESDSVRLELQADCFAGVWAHSAQQRQLLEEGDADEALRAAAAIGDDKLQKQSSGRVMPDAFTHGTSEQRVRWFKRGMQTGDVNSCDTFASSTL